MTLPRRNTARHTCKLGEFRSFYIACTNLTVSALSLGITQHMIKEGLVTLEEVRGADNSLENLYIRVSFFAPSLDDLTLYLSISLTARNAWPMDRLLPENSSSTFKSGRAQLMVLERGTSIPS
jgi:hypothetical protein